MLSQVDLAFVASKVTPEMCDHFEKNPKHLTKFINEVNHPNNLAWAPSKVNLVKGTVANPATKNLGGNEDDKEKGTSHKAAVSIILTSTSPFAYNYFVHIGPNYFRIPNFSLDCDIVSYSLYDVRI
jgi:hypothetical protein